MAAAAAGAGAIVGLAQAVPGIIQAIKGDGASKEQYDALHKATEHIQQQMQEESSDKAELSEQLGVVQKAQEEFQNRLQQEIEEQPRGTTEELRQQSIEKHRLDTQNFNVLLYGSVKAGKSTAGNWLGELSGTKYAYETGQIPISKDGQSDPRRCLREGFEKVFIYDVEGAGAEGQQNTQDGERAFDHVFIIISDALMNEDAAMVMFCVNHNVPFHIVRSQMTIALMKEEDGSEDKVRADYTTHIKEDLEMRHIDFDTEKLLFIDALQGKKERFDEERFLEIVLQGMQSKTG